MAKDEWFEIFLDRFAELGYPRDLVTQWSLPIPDGEKLRELVISLRPRNILEVGTFVGFTSLLLAKYTPPDAKIHTVDPNFPLKIELDSMRTEGGNSNLNLRPQELGLRVAQKLGLDHKITFHAGGFSTGNTFASVKSDPHQTVPIVGPQVCDSFGPFDLVFIDGLHYTDAVLSDLRLAYRYLHTNGSILLHDVIGMWGSNVRRAIWQFLSEAPDFVLQHGRYADIYDGIGLLQQAPTEGRVAPVPSSRQDSGGLLSQPEFVPNLASILVGLCAPGSAVYLGCDRGGLLSSLADLGVKELLHVGTDSLPGSLRKSPSIRIEKFEFHEVYSPSQRFDLCLCLGDGDYLNEKECQNLIESCVKCSDTIFFGSSPPGEGEVAGPWSRPMTWWVREFWKHGYRFHDMIRPMLEPLKFAHSFSPIYTVATSELTNMYLVKREPLKEKDLSLLLEQVLVEKESRIEDLSLQGVYADILIQDNLKGRKINQDSLAKRDADLIETQELLANRDAELLAVLGVPQEKETQKEIFAIASRLAPYLVRSRPLRHFLSRLLGGRKPTKS